MVINGEYAGSYYLAETVRIGKNRLDIDELTAEDNEEPNVTGGYLLALEPFFFNRPTPMENVMGTQRGLRFWFEDPEFYSEDGDEIGTQHQYDYITSYLWNTEAAIMGVDLKDRSGRSYKEFMDINSAADCWWVQDFTLNHDGFETTINYFYKKRDDKIYWGPLWDFDYSMGLLDTTTEGFNQVDYRWFDVMRSYDPEFQQLLRERWIVLDDIITDMMKEGGVFDQFVDQQKKTAEVDYKFWGSCPQAHRKR